MRTLYPELEPFSKDTLESKDGHSIYFEQSGNKIGLPVIFFHGGPGSGCNENHRRYFDPDKYRIIIFDQRGCNRSKPNGCVENNSTQDILDDVESIRNKLKIDKLVYLVVPGERLWHYFMQSNIRNMYLALSYGVHFWPGNVILNGLPMMVLVEFSLTIGKNILPILMRMKCMNV